MPSYHCRECNNPLVEAEPDDETFTYFWCDNCEEVYSEDELIITGS